MKMCLQCVLTTCFGNSLKRREIFPHSLCTSSARSKALLVLVFMEQAKVHEIPHHLFGIPPSQSNKAKEALCYIGPRRRYWHGILVALWTRFNISLLCYNNIKSCIISGAEQGTKLLDWADTSGLWRLAGCKNACQWRHTTQLQLSLVIDWSRLHIKGNTAKRFFLVPSPKTLYDTSVPIWCQHPKNGAVYVLCRQWGCSSSETDGCQEDYQSESASHLGVSLLIVKYKVKSPICFILVTQ